MAAPLTVKVRNPHPKTTTPPRIIESGLRAQS
jgi:hypothetical protein